MSNQLGNFIHETRIKAGLSLHQIASLIGYSNINKGLRRLARLEKEGTCSNFLIQRCSEILNIKQELLQKLIREDVRINCEEWNKWADQPIEPHIVTRIIAAFYIRHVVPHEIKS